MTATNPTDSSAPSKDSSDAIIVEAAVEVGRGVAACYDQLLRVEELPRFLSGVERVERMGGSMTSWIATDEPGGRPWTVEIHDLVEDQRFAWRRVDGPRHETRVQLAAVAPERTLVNLVRKYETSASTTSGPTEDSPQGRASEELHRFKRLVEARPLRVSDRPRRVDLRCDLVGFRAPPHIVRIKFLPSAHGWTLIALMPAGAAPAVARWFEAMGPSSIRIASGIAPKVVSAHFERLPGYCDQLVTAMRLRSLVLTPYGTASLFLTGSPQTVDRFIAKQRLADPTVRAREIRPHPSSLELTRRHVKVLSLAVALGYYEVPHKLTLRELGERLHLSAGTAASTLRGAEGAVISAYIDAVSEERDDEAALETNEPTSQWPRITRVGVPRAQAAQRGIQDRESVADDAEIVDDPA